MLQTVATISSLILAIGALALIAAVLANDWQMVVRAFRNAPQFQPLPLAVQARVTISDRRARVVGVSSQSVPQRAAA
jgi:hypothetical protein